MQYKLLENLRPETEPVLVNDSLILPNTEYFWLSFASWKFFERKHAILMSVAQILKDNERVHASNIATELSEIVGDYALSDSLVQKLEDQGLQLAAGGVVPFTSPSYLFREDSSVDSDKRNAALSMSSSFFTLPDVVAFMESRGLEIKGWSIPNESYTVVEDILHAQGVDCRWDEFMDVLLEVEGHRLPEILLLVRNVRDLPV